MACDEIVAMRHQVCNSLRGTVNTWQYNLQAQWGDPRVYEEEQTERLRQDARVAYDLSRRNSSLLDEAYRARAKKQTEEHNARMSGLKHRGYRKSGTPLQSVEETPVGSRKKRSPVRPVDADPPTPDTAA